MEVRILKGTNQIGGCITEISSNKSKIIIDFGEDLDTGEDTGHINYEIEGLTYGKPKYKAVFITHSHGDHIGLINSIMDGIDVYVEEKSLLIHNITCDFTRKKKVNKEKVKIFYLDETPTQIEDMIITPYKTDHSSYNSCMFTIESHGKKILHTGDFRSHGRNGDILIENLQKIGKVDMLITEGTTLSRDSGKFLTEEEIENEAKELFLKYDQVLIMQSSTNIDRMVSFYNARGNKKVVFDAFTSAITKSLDDIPDINNADIYHWDPNKYIKSKEEWFKKEYMNKHNKPLYGFLPNYIMFIKQSMEPEIRKFKRLGMLGDNVCFVYSMWEGYKTRDEKMKKFINSLENMGFKQEFLHTSGHASKETLKMVEEMVNPEKTIVIHTDSTNEFKNIFEHFIEINDKESVKI